MKIMLAVVAAILVITAAGSGYFIYNLNGQIDSLETQLATSFDEMNVKLAAAGDKIDETTGKLEEKIQANGAAIGDVEKSLSRYTASVDTRITGVEVDVAGNSRDISSLVNDAAQMETLINSNVLQSAELYETARQAIVRITDGESLIGSGFVMVGTPGYNTGAYRKVVTAYHVVKDLSVIYVTLFDGRSFKAKIWASSVASDIAILDFAEPDRPGLPSLDSSRALLLADSLGVKAGDPVFVIGSPGGDSDYLGLTETITTGVVSQVNRGEIIGNQYVTNLIQIDAPVNFGNSGGPLFNIEGKVIGIVIARMDPAQGDGISFAVTSNMIKKVEKIIINGQAGEFKYEYPWVGVASTDLSPADIVENNNTITSGVRVSGVVGPAASAGIRADDIIVKIGSRQLRDSDELSSFVAEYYAPGDIVILTVIRNGTEMEISVELGVKP